MRSPVSRLLIGVCLFAVLGFSGPRSAGGALYERLICVVPMVGTGTVNDPKRPMFAPVAGQTTAEEAPRKGFSYPATMVGFRSVLSDDGMTAIVEFIARDRAAFQPILAQKASLFFWANPHLQSSDTLTQELRKFNKNFDLVSFLRGGL